MSSNTKTGVPARDEATPAKGNSDRHFDTFETRFFQEGDDSSAHPVAAEVFDDLDEGSQRRGFMPTRQFVMRVAIGSAALAVLGCIVLWHGSSHSRAPAVTPKASPSPAVAPAALAEPAAQPVAAQAAVVVAPAVAQGSATAPPAPAEPAPVPQAAAPTPALVAQAPALQAQPVLAAAVADPSKAQPKAQLMKAEPMAAQPAAVSPNAAASSADADEVHSRCKKAISGRRSKEILAACAEAFAADPSASDIAVALAKTEFDRGRTAQAFVWGKKAIAVDPNAAEAYVFIGGAEQSAGHGKAAKEAYKRYLQLAPGGRYAADLRSVVGSL